MYSVLSKPSTERPLSATKPTAIVYGGGSSARYFVEQFAHGLDLVGFSDQQPHQNAAFELPWVEQQSLAQHSADYIVVASWAIVEVTQRLVALGVAPERIKWFQHNKNQLVEASHPDAQHSHRECTQDEILYAFYDLNVARATYDILAFLCLADMARVQQGRRFLHVVLVNATNNAFNNAARGIINTSEHDWRKRQILQQCCGLIESCCAVSMTACRDEAQGLLSKASAVFPADYQVANPVACWEFNELFARTQQVNDIARLKASDQSLVCVDEFLAACNVGHRQVITVTLRESHIKPMRNSQWDEWLAFIKQLNGDDFAVVILPDTERAWVGMQELPPHAFVFTPACFNVELRMAIYERALVNLGVNNGPMHLCAMSPNCDYLMFKQVTPDYAHTSEQSFIERGFTIGGHFPAANSFQRLIWEDDTCDVISREFNQYLRDKQLVSSKNVG